MAFTPFVETDQPTMANFNAKFQEAIGAASLKVARGSYVGNGGTTDSTNTKKISIPFHAKFVIVMPKYYFNVGNTNSHSVLLATPDAGVQINYYTSSRTSQQPSAVTITDTYISFENVILNISGVTYYYLAIG